MCPQVRLWQPMLHSSGCTVDSLEVSAQAGGCPASMAAEELLTPLSSSSSKHSLYLVIGGDAGQNWAWHSVTSYQV